MTSEFIRAQVLQIRKEVSPAYRTEASHRLVARFLWISQIQEGSFLLKGSKVGFYRALPDEVELQPLYQEFQKQGFACFFPRVLPGHQLEFVEMTPSSKWVKSGYGIEEPSPDMQAVDPQELDLIFVPGVAFGESGERIGRGEGYYDRFLARATQALRVSLAYDFQVLPSLPQLNNDQAVHWIFTENREFRMPTIDSWMSQRRSI